MPTFKKKYSKHAPYKKSERTGEDIDMLNDRHMEEEPETFKSYCDSYKDDIDGA